MRYPSERKQETRERILEHAGVLARKHGLAGLAVAKAIERPERLG